MKAHLNGITIEGTPEEIAHYIKLTSQQVKTIAVTTPKVGSAAEDTYDYFKKVISNEIKATFI